MRLDQLQVDLRPRTNAQALDLGFALLRANAARVYLVWLALWIPLVFLSALSSYLLFDSAQTAMSFAFIFAWWLRPWIERAPLFMLSRQVFGEQVSCWDTLKAWPKQLGGGFVRLFILRPFAAGRGLYQSIWQLEAARKSVARYRIRVLGHNTIGSATWFGIACAHFEGIIQVGIFATIGLFLSDKEAANPFALFLTANEGNVLPIYICSIAAYCIATGLIGPIYCACCFTLYLNRRATLEAWDLEIALRQITPSAHQANSSPKKRAPQILSLIFGLLLLSGLGTQQPVRAETSEPTVNSTPKCEQDKLQYKTDLQRTDTSDLETQKTRKQIDKIYQDKEFDLYSCEKRWVPKPSKKETSKAEQVEMSERMKLIASILKYVFIGIGVAALIWLIVRYQGQFFGFEANSKSVLATEVAGLDIRPESLPDNVSASAEQLWQQGQQRAAIALLYRASLARLVERHALHINKGATEQDCLRLSGQLFEQNPSLVGLQQCFELCTETWLEAAYANLFPSSIAPLCQQWQQFFDAEVVA